MESGRTYPRMEARSGQIFGTQLNPKASAAIAAAAAAAAAAAQEAGLPPIPLKFLRGKGSGNAAIAALEVWGGCELNSFSSDPRLERLLVSTRAR